MSLQEKLKGIRKQSGLTQQELACKLFVTRQAVSRWENGDTTPTVDTLRAISDLFKIDANALLETTTAVCQSCAMPLKNLGDIGANGDKTVNIDYCRYCFDGGRFTSDLTVLEAVELNLKCLTEFNAQNGSSFSEEEAREILRQYLPTLKRWNTAR